MKFAALWELTMTPKEYHAKAEQYRLLKEEARDEFERFQLERIEQSYRTLADALRKLLGDIELPRRDNAPTKRAPGRSPD